MMNYGALKDHLMRSKDTIDRTKNESDLKSRRKSGESLGSIETESVRKRVLSDSGTPNSRDEERMLDVAESCFMRIADLLHSKRETVKQVFGKYAEQEPFKDAVLDLVQPRDFLKGVKELGFDDITEIEAACLMKVLAKPELEGQIILNEFVLIMENFGIPATTDEDEYENDYLPDTDTEQVDEELPEMPKGDNLTIEERFTRAYVMAKKSNCKNPLLVKFSDMPARAYKCLKKLARFLLERYMHPREFFGPTIKKEVIGVCKVEVIKLHEFYLRLKLASIRKKLKEKPELNEFLAIDGDKHPGFVHVKKMIKVLELIAEGEQEELIKEAKEKESEIKLQDDSERKETKAPQKDDVIQKESEQKSQGGGMNEMMKLGGVSGKSPKGGSKKASHLAPPG